MKNTIYILSILILFQSCYSYKAFDIKEYETIKPQKIKVELKDSRRFKGKIIKLQKETLFIKNIAKTIEIPISEIKEIKTGKHLWLETTLLAVGSFLIGGSFLIVSAFTNGWK